MLLFGVRIVVIALAVIVLAWLTATLTEERSQKAEVRRQKSEVRSQKIDDLPVLATHRSGTSAMLSSKVNGPVAHGNTQ